jgi:hypothetical protein
MSLPAEFSQDYGPILLMRVDENSPKGDCEANVRLADPVTGDAISEDINPFTIAATTGGYLKPQPVIQAAPQEFPSMATDCSAANPQPQCLYMNSGASSAAVEVKVWLESPGFKPVPLISAGWDESIDLPAGAVLTLNPLALLRAPAGTYVLRSRALDPASGQILAQTQTDLVIQ